MATANEVVLKVMADVRGLAKKDKNQAQGFNFRGIDAVMNAVGPALRDAGGFIVPEALESEYSTVPTKNGGLSQICRLRVAFSVYGTEGNPIVGVVSAEAFDSGDKATAKAMSVAMRTFILQLLCLPTDEPDPDSFSYESVAPARNWVNEADLLHFAKDKDGLKALYNEAKASKVTDAVLQKIIDYGQSL